MRSLSFALLLMLPAIAFGQGALTPAQISKRVSPAVVAVEGQTDSGKSFGSGFIISKDGKIVTNLHVIRDLKSMTVHLANGDIFDSASVLAIDERRDLAILQIAGFNLPILEMGDSNTLSVGDPVVVVGNPRGLQGTVTSGILSSVRDSSDGFRVLQTDAAVNPGNSGGPLLNNRGQAVGVVSFKLRSAEGLNFAVAINYVRGLLNKPHTPMTLDQMRRLLSTAATSQENGGPSLDETLDWLKEKISLARFEWVFLTSNGVKTRVTYQARALSVDTCTLVLRADTIEETTGDHRISRASCTLPLSIVTEIYVKENEVPPSVNFLSGDKNTYDVVLTSKLSNINCMLSSSQSSELPRSSNLDTFNLGFSDQALANRVTNAFSRAVALCRKKEIF